MKTRLAIILSLSCAVTAYGAEQQTSYLAPGEFDVTRIIEPAPRPGDPRYEADRKIFRATRRLIDTPRWRLAINDADFTSPALLRDFSCAVGVTMTADDASKTLVVLKRASADTGRQNNEAKELYRRQRPFTIDRGRICQPTSQLYDAGAAHMSYDYPSGHTTLGWTWGLVLAGLAPDRSQEIMERARAYGDSRFVCGAHNESAVEAGFVSATVTMSLVASKPAYQADLNAARAELNALRATGPQPTGCPAEAKLVSERVMPKLAKGE